MKSRFALMVLSFVLACALPMGTAFAAVSPNADSPNVNSPNVNSPNVNSPNVNSPNVNSPNVDSPNVDSPNVDSPNVDSPNVDSPNVDSPAISESNIAINSLDAAGSVSKAYSNVSAEGVLLAPHAGAFNLAVVAGASVALFMVAGVAAWAIRRKILQ